MIISKTVCAFTIICVVCRITSTTDEVIRHLGDEHSSYNFRSNRILCLSRRKAQKGL